MPAQNTQSYEHASHILLSTPYIPFKSKKIPKVFVSIRANIFGSCLSSGRLFLAVIDKISAWSLVIKFWFRG